MLPPRARTALCPVRKVRVARMQGPAASPALSPTSVVITTDSQTVAPISLRKALRCRCWLIAILLGLLLLALAAVATLAIIFNLNSQCAIGPEEDVRTIVQAATVGSNCNSHELLNHLQLPPGMESSVFVCGLLAPRQLTPVRIDVIGDVLFVGSRAFRQNSSVYAIVNAEADGVADTVVTIDSGLDQPNGVEWLNDVLYVATARALLRYDGVERALRGEADHTRRTVINAETFPALAQLQWHYLRAFDGALYASNSAGCDHCVPPDVKAAAIVRLDPKNCFAASVHTAGVRFSVGFAFDPAGELIFTNNAHDSVDADPAWDTINRAPSAGRDFGFPHCYTTGESQSSASSMEYLQSGHASDYSTNDAGPSEATCAAYARGKAIGEHIAPLGVCFRDAEELLIAERGAFGGPPAGHQISTIRVDFTGYSPLITGFVNMSSGTSWGRPVDVQMAPGGGDVFFVSDDKSHSILRFVGSNRASV